MFKELTCNCCGYIPDKEDIEKSNYHLTQCSKCGQWVCDLCACKEVKPGNSLWVDVKEIEDDPYICIVCLGLEPKGINRKSLLQNEYK